MKLAYVTPFDARDVSRWSGTPHYMAKSLAPHCDRFRYIGPLRKRTGVTERLRRLYHRKVLRCRYLGRRAPRVIAGYAEEVKARLREEPADVILTPWTIAVADLEVETPIVIWADACFGALVDYYREFTGLCDASLAQGHRVESRAFARAARVVFSSEWAAQSAMALYGIPESRVEVVPFGANMERECTQEDLEESLRLRRQGELRLLFVGKDWKRKGGEVVLETVRALLARGEAVRLDVVGCTPDLPNDLRSHVRLVGMLDKGDEAQRRKLERLYMESHFLLVPSRAEAFGIVYCEAAAFGLPSVVCDTGGIPVAEGVNGIRLPLEGKGADFAERILEVYGNPQGYEALCHRSFHRFSRELNWTTAAERMSRLLSDLARGPSP